jgi:nucleoid-associated protein YgaU
LCGDCESADNKEKAVLLAGNVKGVTKVNADALNAPTPPAAAEVKYYVVQSGDSLSKIAQEFYGKASEYPRIFEANREVIKDPNLIYPGQKLRIPMA